MKFIRGWGLVFWVGVMAGAGAAAQPVQLGAGTYFLSPRGNDQPVPPAPFRGEAQLKKAAPSSQWYSTLIFNAKPEVIFVQPLTVQATPAGFEMALPSKDVVPTERRDVEIHYPHRDPLAISPTAFEPGQAKLARASDWAIDIAMDRSDDRFMATVAHGSPYVSFRISRGDARVRLPAAAERLQAGGDPRVLAKRFWRLRSF